MPPPPSRVPARSGLELGKPLRWLKGLLGAPDEKYLAGAADAQDFEVRQQLLQHERNMPLGSEVRGEPGRNAGDR